MIRREMKAMDGSAIWLFISQVDHAHLSAELMRHWREKLSAEIVEGIWHHDDGWADWELEPKLNPERGGRPSFLEMPVEDPLASWHGSIEAARKRGPRAGRILAGHFYNLLAHSGHTNEPR